MTPTGSAEPQPANEQPGTAGSFRLLGVPVRLHFTFLLLLVFLLFLGFGGQASAATNSLYILALFGSVLMHEMGHALVARRFGIRTLEITMFPIGGVSRLDRTPAPREEFWIALAGPMVNLLIAGAVYGFLALQNRTLDMGRMHPPTDENLGLRLLFGNLLLAGFNLLPAFPMDGGRILRALLSANRSPEVATRLAAKAGRWLAIAMGLYGLLAGNYFLVFVAFFVYLGAAQESAAATGRLLTHGVPVRAAMITDYRTLVHGDTIGQAADLLLATSQQDFPVMHGDQVLGLLTRSALIRAMATSGAGGYVAGAMDREFVRLAPELDLAEALPRMAEAGSCALVMDGEHLVGLLTAENLSEFLLLRRVGMQPAALRPV